MKIKSISIENFRGVKSQNTLLFEKNEKPLSVLIYGDNGTGKSSIVDAIEFALQGRIQNTRNFKSEYSPEINFLGSSVNSIVKVIFENNDTLSREMRYEDYMLINKTPHEKFNISPFVLRRKDITTFWATPSKKRLTNFLQFFPKKEDITLTERLSSEILELENKRDKLKRDRDKIRETLADKINISINKIPFDNKPFDRFIKNFFFEGLSKSHFKNKKIPKHKVYEEINSDLVEYRNIYSKIKEINKEIKKLQNPLLEQNHKKAVNQFLQEADENIRLAFHCFSTANFVEDIIIEAGEINEVSLKLTLKLKNGSLTSPEKVLSEANLDLLAAIIYLSIIKNAADEYGQGKILILDDVLQSIDYNIRLNFIEYLMEYFSDWQIFFTVHDRVWKENIISELRRKNHKLIEYEIKRWDLDNGPQIIDTHSDKYLKLKEYIDTGSVQEICNYSGFLLEYICEELSYILKLKLPRERGGKYTLSPLWTTLKSHRIANTSLKSTLDKIDRTISLRNLLGCHYNSWADTIPNMEVQEFGNNVLEFYSKVYCQDCKSWIKSIFNKYICTKNCENQISIDKR
jgi:energy-coupling factor transporter ATP-binding protein EcfA2